jgi:hypothetical protein
MVISQKSNCIVVLSEDKRGDCVVAHNVDEKLDCMSEGKLSKEDKKLDCIVALSEPFFTTYELVVQMYERILSVSRKKLDDEKGHRKHKNMIKKG